MAEYLIEIQGIHDLAQINLQIAGEEAGASEFVSSSIVFYEGRVTNIVKFRELAPGTIPKTLTIVKHDDPQPSGTRLTWSGVMIIKGTTEAVSAYRAT
jgi:hypothetical protein